MPNLVHGQDPGGALRPIQVDDNGNLVVDIVSGVSVSASATITGTIQTQQVSGANDSVYITGSSGTTVIIGDVDADVADTGDAPVKVGGIARQANPGAVAAGDRVSATFDDLGRQVITPYQVRDLITTAYVTTSTGIETTLAAAVAGAYLDLVQIIAANTSGAAVDVDFRAVTAGNVVFSLTIPADSTSGFIPVIPYPQGDTGNNWTVDVAGSDVSNTTVNFTAVFIRNV